MEVNKEKLEGMSLGELCSLHQYLQSRSAYYSKRSKEVNYENEMMVVRNLMEERLDNIFIY